MDKASILRLHPNSAIIESAEAYWSLPSTKQIRRLGIQPVSKTFTVKADTIASSAIFKKAFAESRCLVPARAWYEYSYRRQPKSTWQIGPKGSGIIFFAGFWLRCNDPDNGPTDRFTIIVEPAGCPLNAVTDYAPVVLWGSDCQVWLDPKAPIQELYQLLGPESPDGFEVERITDPELRSVVRGPQRRAPRQVLSNVEKLAKSAAHLSAMASKLEERGRLREAACYRLDADRMNERHSSLLRENNYLPRKSANGRGR
ncbi:MAG TPA: SOS response-associated peptidase family protein [Terriglobales bacterium]|nr:SOS response-associated peptidase family protein [Terriglobales bacterium]